MFDVSRKLQDPLIGEIGAALMAIQAIRTWTAEKSRLNVALQALLVAQGYLRFVGHPSRYHLARVGQSCLYEVPVSRQGVLRPFRGKTVRIVCVSSGRFDRQLMAGELKPREDQGQAMHAHQPPTEGMS
jgi:hypothetical protein